MDVDAIQSLLGGYKPFQMVSFLCLGLFNMHLSWHIFSSMYLGFDPGHHCTPAPNTTLNQSVPWDSEAGAWSQCEMYATPGESNETVGCQYGWTFDLQHGETSFGEEWSLVCHKQYLVELSTTIYMVGMTCGAVFVSPLADAFGGKTVVLTCMWLQAALGFGLAWVTDYITFCVIRFFIGLTNMAIGLGTFVLLSEIFPSTHRLLPAICMPIFWAVGNMVLPLFGYLVRDWRHLEMLISLPNLLSVVCIWVLSESFPWLVSKNKLDKAEAVLQRAAKMNKIVLPSDIRQTLHTAYTMSREKDENSSSQSTKEGTNTLESKDAKITVLGLLCVPKVNIYCFIMFYLFLANSLGYFGVVFLTPTLNGDRFLNLFISAAVELPADAIAYICNTRIGRRMTMCGFMLLCAAANIAGIFVPDTTGDGGDLTPLKTSLMLLGKFGITGSYSSLYLLATEIFPTSVRNQAMGMASFFENIGSISAPALIIAARTWSYLPVSIFGGVTAVGGILVLFLPETHRRPLPQSVAEVQAWGRGTGDRKPVTDILRDGQ